MAPVTREEIGLGAGQPVMIGATALLLSFALTPMWQHLANRLGLVEKPGPRRVHRTPTPTSGGLVVFVSLWTALLVAPSAAGVEVVGWPAVGATAFLLVLGLLDDIFDLKPGVKLAGQLISAAMFVSASGSLATQNLFLPGVALFPWLNGLAAIVWLVAMVNIFNIIDGLDGLAGGLAVVAALPLLALAWQLGEGPAAAMSAALIGALIGFLRYNVHPARLFLGDAGGMLIGFVIGIVSLKGMAAGSAVSPAIVLLTVAVPLFDTLFAVLRRWSRGAPIARADAMHTHHQLLRHGFGTPGAVGLLYGVGAAGAGLALLLAGRAPWAAWTALALVGAAAWPWARRIGVLGGDATMPGARRAAPRMPQLVSSDPVDFHEETGKFQGIAK